MLFVVASVNFPRALVPFSLVSVVICIKFAIASTGIPAACVIMRIDNLAARAFARTKPYCFRARRASTAAMTFNNAGCHRFSRNSTEGFRPVLCFAPKRKPTTRAHLMQPGERWPRQVHSARTSTHTHRIFPLTTNSDIQIHIYGCTKISSTNGILEFRCKFENWTFWCSSLNIFTNYCIQI